MSMHGSIALKEKEVLRAVDTSGLTHTKEVAARVDRFSYEVVRRTLNDLLDGGYVAKSDDSLVRGNLWETTLKGKRVLE